MATSKSILPSLINEPPFHEKLKDARLKIDESTNQPYLIQEDHDDGRIRVLKINRLKAKNGFDDWLYLVISDALNVAAADEKVLVVVLTGEGEYFSSGADLRAEMAGGQGLKLGRGNIYDPVGVFMRTFLRFPKPLIAAVNGPAIGVGATLVPHCDLVYASETASFLTPFSRLAFVPEFCSSVTFPKIMGTTVANEMLFLSKTMSVTRAREVGFVSDVFPQKGFLERVLQELKAGLAFPVLDKTLPLFKHMVKRYDIDDLERSCIYELEQLDERGRNGESAEAIIAFMQSSQKKKGKASL